MTAVCMTSIVLLAGACKEPVDSLHPSNGIFGENCSFRWMDNSWTAPQPLGNGLLMSVFSTSGGDFDFSRLAAYSCPNTEGVEVYWKDSSQAQSVSNDIMDVDPVYSLLAKRLKELASTSDGEFSPSPHINLRAECACRLHYDIEVVAH